jgi:hypothetical protein
MWRLKWLAIAAAFFVAVPFLSNPLLASGTVVYLPAPGALTSYTITGATAGTPIVVTVSGSPPANGTALWIYGVGGNLCVNGFWITAGASGSTFQLTYMYFGGNANGSFSNCTGTYTGGGTAVVLTGYTLTPHPRVLLDGPSGTLYNSLLGTGSTGKSNTNNPPYSAMNTAYNDLYSAPYTTDDVDSSTALANGSYFERFAASCFIWNATGNSTASTVCDWGIDHIEQLFGPPDNFYCAASSQCGNWNDSTVMDYGSFKVLDILNAYSLYHGQLTSGEITTFANKMLNDNSYLTNGLGMPGSPTTSCANNNDNPWAAGDCGYTFLMRHLAYSPPIATGQESHYTSDYTTATNAGASVYPFSTGNPPVQNLTGAKLYGYIMTGLALADDDVRAQMLLTQAYTFWYQWYWAWANSNWTGFDQGASRYTCYRIHPYNTEIALAMKNSTGLDVSSGVYLERQLAYYLFLTRPDLNTTNGPTDSWGTIFGSCSNVNDATTAPLAATWLYSSDSLVPFVNYWYGTTWGAYNTAGYLSPGVGGNIIYTFRPYLFMAPNATQTNPSGNLPSQYVFKDNDYGLCTTALTSSDCYSNEGLDHAVSKSDWSTTASYIFQRAGWLATGTFDHYCEEQGTGCDTISYHIYREGYLLAPSGDDNSPGGSADNTIQLGGSDSNYQTPSYAPITRWASTDPSGDSSSRYAYWMVDASNIFTSSMGVTRAQRHVVHFKKSGAQDYVVSYDDVATATGEQIESYWHYNAAPTTGPGTATYSNGTGSIASAFLPVTGTLAQVSLSDGVGVCAGSGSTCNTSATSFESIAVHMPSPGTSATMPTISQDACVGVGGNCTVAEIMDSSSPKVAVFARQGALLTGLSFTTMTSGTLQYLIAGLSPGSYNVAVNGSTVVSGAAVNAGDNTLYFESTNTSVGSVVVAQAVAQPSFSITAAPSSETVTAGGSTAYTATVGALSGFTGTVTLSVSDLPSGASGSFSPAAISTSGSSTLTITTTSGTAAGTYTVAITGTSGSTQQSLTATLVINAASTPSFTLSSTPSSETVTAGGSTTYTATVGALSGFTGTVTLSVSGLPTGASGSFSPATISTSGSSTLTITTTSGTAAGTYTVTITGTSGSTQRTSTATLVINAAATPNFTLSPTPTSETVVAGGSTTYTATVGALSGFTGTVTLSVSGLPTGASGSFSPATISTSGSSTLTIATTSGVAAGTYTVTIAGTSGSLKSSVALNLNITVPSASVTVSTSPTSATIGAGQSAQFTVSMAGSSALTSSSFTCAGLPSYATCQFSTPSTSVNGLSVTSTLTLTISTQAKSLRGHRGRAFAAAFMSTTGLGLFSWVFAGFGERRRRAVGLLVAGAVIFFVALGACAGTASNSTGDENPDPTNFAFSVNGTTQESGTTASNTTAINIAVN